MTKIAVWLDTVKPGFGAAYGQVFADMGCDDESDLQYFKQAGKLTAVAGKLTATAGEKFINKLKIMQAIKAVLAETTLPVSKPNPKPKPTACERPPPPEPESPPSRGGSSRGGSSCGGSSRRGGSSSRGGSSRGVDSSSTSTGDTAIGSRKRTWRSCTTRSAQEGMRDEILTAFFAAQDNKDLDAMMKAKNDLKCYLEKHSAHEQDRDLHRQIEEAICVFRGHE